MIESLRTFIASDVVDQEGRVMGKFSRLLVNEETGRVVGIQLDDNRSLLADKNRILFVQELQGDGSIRRYVKVLPLKVEKVEEAKGGGDEYDDIRREVDRLLDELDEILLNLVNLDRMLIKGSISETTFLQVRDDLVRRKMLLLTRCRDLLGEIGDRLENIDKKIGELQMRKGELLLRLTLGGEDARAQLVEVESKLAGLMKVKAELISLKSSLEAVCLLK